MSEVTRDEFNGLGKRLGGLEREVAGMKTETVRNSQDIQKIFTSLEKLPLKIMFIMAIPTILMAYQIWAK